MRIHKLVHSAVEAVLQESGPVGEQFLHNLQNRRRSAPRPIRNSAHKRDEPSVDTERSRLERDDIQLPADGRQTRLHRDDNQRGDTQRDPERQRAQRLRQELHLRMAPLPQSHSIKLQHGREQLHALLRRL